MTNRKPTYEALLRENENLKRELSHKFEIERSLMESEEKFRMMVENSPDTIIIQDLNGISTFISPQLKDLSGFDPDSLLHKQIPVEYIFPDDLEMVISALKSLKENQNSLKLEYRIFRASGEIIWVRHTARPVIIDGTVTGFQNHLKDITKEKRDQEERKKIEKELAYAQIVMQTAFDQSPVPMVVATYPDFTFKIINKATEDFLLLNASDYLNKKPVEVDWNWQEFYPDGNPVTSIADLPLPQALQGITTKNVEMTIVRHDGSKVVELASGAPIYGADGELIAGILAMVDITERKKSEQILKDNELTLKEQNEEYEALNEELREANEQLQIAKEKAEESDKLKTAFLQNMSHEIRTPMNAIIGFSNILSEEDMSDEKRKSFTTIIKNSGYQLLSIVEEILTISALETKQEKVTIQKTCVNDILVDLAAIYKIDANDKNLSLYSNLDLTDTQSEIYTDKTKLTQILTNLITNALKFTHTGFIEFGYTFKDNYLEFYVKDSGMGIKAEMHEIIFDRFRQADDFIQINYGGAGLGLAISKAFVELLGGTIRVDSEVNKGAAFYFSIPYRPVNEIDIINTPAKQNESFKTVLVAEDEEYNFLFIEELLRGKSIKIIHAKNGLETIELCKSNPEIEIILMDIKMPLMDGYSAAKQIKSFLPGIPIIAQSAYALASEIEMYGDIFDDYLTKPINRDKFNILLTKYIDK
jgi:PAS domain S-box-containing protein